MTRAITRVGVLLFFWISIPLHSDQLLSLEVANISTGPVDAWVLPVEFSDDIDEAQCGQIAPLLVDRQYHASFGKCYLHIAEKLLNNQAVQNRSIINIDFDPNYQNIKMHYICVYRDGEILDKLEGVSQQVARAEKLDDLIYGDKHTLTLFLKDIREGDILEHAYTIEDNSSELFSYVQGGLHLRGNAYIKKISHRLIADKNLEIGFKNHGIDTEPCVQDLDDRLNEWTWEFEDIEPITRESHQPSWFNNHSYVQVSSFKSWADVAQFYRKYYEVPSDYSQELLDQVNSWKLLYPDKEGQILAAIRFVQNEIRYLSLHEGVGAFAPHHPNEVFSRRYGDCKDQTVLLVTLLNLLGVEAHSAVVNTIQKHVVKDLLPSTSFNHVIVHFKFQEKSFFVDPTYTNQGGGLSGLHVKPYGYALVLTEDCHELTKVPVSKGQSKHQKIYNYTIDLAKGLGQVEVISTRIGTAASSYRNSLQAISLNDRLERHAKLYGFLEYIQPPTIEDCLEENTIIENSSFLIEKLDADHIVYPTLIQSYIPIKLDLNRTSPYAIHFPIELEEIVDIQLKVDPPDPEGYFDAIEEKIVSFKNASIEYTVEQIKISPTHFKFIANYKTLSDSISPEDLIEVEDQLEVLKSAFKVFDQLL